MGSNNSILNTSDEYLKLFTIKNIISDGYITITCKYCDNEVIIDDIHKLNTEIMYKDEIIKFLRLEEFDMDISYKKQKVSVKILPENSECIIFLNGYNKLCFIIS